MTKTKIVCTIGPSVDSLEKIIELLQKGMNVARLNFSHGTHESHQKIIQQLKFARQQLQCPLAIMLDTKGPEVRLGKIATQQVNLEHGQMWHLLQEEGEGNAQQISIHPGQILKNLTIGTRLLFDDGNISAEVVEKTKTGVMVIIDQGGPISSGKGVNIPNTILDLPAVTAKDIEDIQFGAAQDVDMIAASFVRGAQHVREIKEILQAAKKSEILVIAKIENKEGIENFDAILHESDGIMIARGDLGVEMPYEQLPGLQKMMIRKCYFAGKPVITSTQMLESMINQSRPLRAEVSDVANAVYDGTSATMLSGETAVGHYPIQTVEAMRRIIAAAEHDFDFVNFWQQHLSIPQTISASLTLAALLTAFQIGAKAIFTGCYQGARFLARLHPRMPILAITANPKIFHQMSLLCGVIPILQSDFTSLNDGIKEISHFALQRELLTDGDFVLVVFSQHGATIDAISVEQVNSAS